jgi:hypothetical protein
MRPILGLSSSAAVVASRTAAAFPLVKAMLEIDSEDGSRIGEDGALADMTERGGDVARGALELAPTTPAADGQHGSENKRGDRQHDDQLQEREAAAPFAHRVVTPWVSTALIAWLSGPTVNKSYSAD